MSNLSRLIAVSSGLRELELASYEVGYNTQVVDLANYPESRKSLKGRRAVRFSNVLSTLPAYLMPTERPLRHSRMQ
jgi:hypothetical protein